MIAFWMEMVISNHFFHGKDLRTIIQPKQPAKKEGVKSTSCQDRTLHSLQGLQPGTRALFRVFLRTPVKPMDLLGHGYPQRVRPCKMNPC